jgi:hypothetical protein
MGAFNGFRFVGKFTQDVDFIANVHKSFVSMKRNFFMKNRFEIVWFKGKILIMTNQFVLSIVFELSKIEPLPPPLSAAYIIVRHLLA